MRAISVLVPAVFAAVAIANTVPLPLHQLQKRAELETCSDLTVSNNNGNRKVVIVIDSSGSMSTADRSNLRLSAARALNDFLIANSEAKGGKKADQVAVVGFGSSAYTVFGPGDPGNPDANAAISGIAIGGGTYIAGGMYEAMDHIAAMTGETKDRSAIVVFTDGADSDTPRLVNAISNATSQGIRVSFGYLDRTASAQPTAVLHALRESKGVYATITVAAGSQNFVNYVLLNGLTSQDNPQGAGDRLLAGLATTQFISGSNPVTLKYSAEKGEAANFTVVSFTNDRLTVEAKIGGQTFRPVASTASVRQFLNLTAPSGGTLEVTVSASTPPKDGLFSVSTNSNQPIKNCTVGVSGSGSSGLTDGAKAGVGIGVTFLVAGLLAGGVYAYKHLFAAASNASPPPVINNGAPSVPPPAEASPGWYNPGAEKPSPFSNVAPFASAGAPPAIQSMPPGSGFEGYPIGQALGGGDAPLSSIPPDGISPSSPGPMDMPPDGSPGGGGPSHSGAFIPPIVPPPFFKNSHQDSQSRPGTTHAHGSPPSPGVGHDQYPLGPNLFDDNTAGTPTSWSSPSPYDPNSPGSYSGYSDVPGAIKGGGARGDAGFPIPSPPTSQQAVKDKHHHHPWLAPDMACEHEECPLNLRSHECEPDWERCLCTCRDGACRVKRRWM